MKTEILIPQGWHEVTIEQLQELQTLKKEDDDYDVQLISILCDLDPDLVSRLTVSTYSTILLNLTWINKLPGEANYKPIITVNGNEYGLVKLSSLTNGEWYSLEEWLNEPSENIHKILALLYRPLITAINDDYRIVEDYNSIDAEQRAEVFKKCNVDEMYGAFVFFYHIEKESIKTIRDYLQIQVVVRGMRVPTKLKNWMLKKSLSGWSKGNGHGIPFFTRQLKATSERLKKSQDTTSYSPSLTKPLN